MTPHELVGRDGEVAVRRARRRPQLVERQQVLVDEHPQRLAVAERGHAADRIPGGRRARCRRPPATPARRRRRSPACASSSRLSPLTRATTASPSTAKTSDFTIWPEVDADRQRRVGRRAGAVRELLRVDVEAQSPACLHDGPHVAVHQPRCWHTSGCRGQCRRSSTSTWTRSTRRWRSWRTRPRRPARHRRRHRQPGGGGGLLLRGPGLRGPLGHAVGAGPAACAPTPCSCPGGSTATRSTADASTRSCLVHAAGGGHRASTRLSRRGRGPAPAGRAADIARDRDRIPDELGLSASVGVGDEQAGQAGVGGGQAPGDPGGPLPGWA